jgi:uncharacterized protein (TIGR02453 family)
MLHSASLLFLKDLAQNNNREWFQENRKQYDTAKADMERLIGGVIAEVSKFHDLGHVQVKDCVFRINRDIRFSKNKAPYKNNLSAGIGPGGRGAGKIDFYLHIQPEGKSFLGGGMWAPSTEQLAKYRQEVDYNSQELKDIIHAAEFRSYFPDLHGEVLKTTPKGYPKDHPEIELLKRKELFFTHSYTDAQVTSPGFLDDVVSGMRILKTFIDYMNYVLSVSPEE